MNMIYIYIYISNALRAVSATVPDSSEVIWMWLGKSAFQNTPKHVPTGREECSHFFAYGLYFSNNFALKIEFLGTI